MPDTLARSDPAAIYDRDFVPALFAAWGPVVTALAGVAPGDRVLDVGCGTGALALAALDAARPAGRVSGLDRNPDMLAVARSKPAPIDWVEGRAEALPFPDAAFDAVASQFAFMFFDDPPQALREMQRVLAPGGGLAVAVCDDVEASPGYAALARLCDALFGPDVGRAMRAPFAMGDPALLLAHAAAAGLRAPRIARASRPVRFASVRACVGAEHACIWSLGGLIDDAGFEALVAEAERALAPLVAADGALAFDMPALVLMAGGDGRR